tara:strand:- start:313 stop:600 length:288 start_codon:yes stop_codon:yes gene_type:complete
MATISIDSAEVVRLIPGYGFEIAEQIKTFKGDLIKVYYAVWYKDANVAVGDLVSVEGDYSAKLDEYTGADNIPKHKISVSINNPAIMPVTEDAPF